MKEFSIDKNLKKKLKEAYIDELRERAKDCLKDLENFYLSEEVEQFYTEFTPQVYKRHPYNVIEESGMARTYRKIYEEYDEENFFAIRAGLYVNTDEMYKDYKGTPDQVLYSFTNGYHGLPLPTTTRSSLRPIEDSRNYIVDELSKKLDKPLKLKLKK